MKKYFTDGLIWMWIVGALIGAAVYMSVPAKADWYNRCAEVTIYNRHGCPGKCDVVDTLNFMTCPGSNSGPQDEEDEEPPVVAP